MSTLKDPITKTFQLRTEFIQSFRREPFSSGLIPSVFFQSRLEMDWLPVGRGGALRMHLNVKGRVLKPSTFAKKTLLTLPFVTSMTDTQKHHPAATTPPPVM